MIDPIQSAGMDQAVATAREIFGPMWWAIYESCKNQGFTEDQSMQLLIAYIESQGRNP